MGCYSFEWLTGLQIVICEIGNEGILFIYLFTYSFKSFNLPEGLNVNVVASVALITGYPLVQESGGLEME